MLETKVQIGRQIRIPATIATKYQLQAGDKLRVVQRVEGFLLVPRKRRTSNGTLRNKQNLKAQLKEGAMRRAERDLRIANEWFGLEEEAWQKSPK